DRDQGHILVKELIHEIYHYQYANRCMPKKGNHVEPCKEERRYMEPPHLPAEPKPTNAPSRPKCFRVKDVPKDWDIENLRRALETLDPALRDQEYRLSLYPACYGTSQVGILNIPNCTSYFSQIVPYKPFLRTVLNGDLTIDCDFDGFTPFNNPNEIYAESRDSGRMWLQDFLPSDLPGVRIMSFGYDSKIEAKQTDRMLDYARSFASQLHNVRSSKEARSRPIIFLGHSLGGTLILEILEEARTIRSRYSSLLDTTFATFFFGTPHRGLRTEELEAMARDLISDDNQTLDLLRMLKSGSDFLARRRRSLADILAKKKVVSFYETLESEVVKK
ncbi:433_t:CDS:2, partial [Acaulospora colombiana]